MSTNRALTEVFEQMALALELMGANRFRVAAHQRVARWLKDHTEDVGKLVASEPETAVTRLTAFDGVGKATAEKIVEYLDTGEVREHQELLEKVPKGLFEVLAIPGIGPKAAKAMWEGLGITNVAELKEKLDTPELAALPRMGAKTIANIRKAIEFAEKSGGRIPMGVARPLALEIREHLRAVSGVQRCDIAGSLRRGRETIGDLDFLVSCDDAEAVREAFVTHPSVTQVLARGETKCSVRLEARKVVLQADLRLVEDAAFGSALMYFTGSKEHNVRLRELAIKQRKHLNEYGLFAGTEERPQDRGEQPLAVEEEAIYAELGLPYIPPERREDRGELEQPDLPLIELGDVRAELHAHTTASDGRLSIEEMALAARNRGFHTFAVTDHSKSSVVANGLSPERLREHIQAVREADRQVEGIRILAGSEVDILPDGSLDYEDELLAQLDLVVASPHISLRQEPDVATARLLAAIRHPLVHIIGHPTGRIVGRREGMSPDLGALFQAADECNTALELNANWQRLDLRDNHLRAALDSSDCVFAIDTDAHDEPHLDFLVYGILTARRAGMPAERCINTWPAEKLHAWLAAKR